jgi:flavin-binding protein dodecin
MLQTIVYQSRENL